MSDDPTAFLYPFLDGDERDPAALLVELARSAESKVAESDRLSRSTIASCRPRLEEAATEVAARLAAGGCLFSFGNGGSASDAELVADLFATPPFGRPLRASSLSRDTCVLTALANDVGFDLVFSRQLIASAAGGDVALGLSTSGSSENLMRAFGESRRLGLLTIGLAGYGGGRMATSPDLDYCFVVSSSSVHRIQEAENALLFELWRLVQEALTPSVSAGAPL